MYIRLIVKLTSYEGWAGLDPSKRLRLTCPRQTPRTDLMHLCRQPLFRPTLGQKPLSLPPSVPLSCTSSTASISRALLLASHSSRTYNIHYPLPTPSMPRRVTQSCGIFVHTYYYSVVHDHESTRLAMHTVLYVRRWTTTNTAAT